MHRKRSVESDRWENQDVNSGRATVQRTNLQSKCEGRGDSAAALLADAQAIEEAGASAVVMEMVPAQLAGKVTAQLSIPTIGIGAGPYCDGQVLVWHDAMAVPADGHRPRFSHVFSAAGSALYEGAVAYREAVAEGSFPAQQHCFSDQK